MGVGPEYLVLSYFGLFDDVGEMLGCGVVMCFAVHCGGFFC